MTEITIWRTKSASSDGRFRVWEVVEVLTHKRRDLDPRYVYGTYTKCRDDSYILISCTHLWSEENTDYLMNAPDFFGQSVFII